MPADVARLPVTIAPAEGEAIDGFLERLAAVNDITHPDLTRRLRTGHASTAFLTVAPDPQTASNLASLAVLDTAAISAATLSGLPGIDTTGLNPRDRASWRIVASRGWPPERGTALCPSCFRADGLWRLAWRHPWVTTCARHRCRLVGICPGCGLRFRSHRTPMRVDLPREVCGNPDKGRGQNCLQLLADLDADPAPDAVLATQRRIDAALNGERVTVLGEAFEPGPYLDEVKALTVLMLHLATQPGADEWVSWANAARVDRCRSGAGRGARWGLAPPEDLALRGDALAAADAILSQPDLENAAEALHPWTELTPACTDGQLGWLADHTTKTPTLSRLVMSATAARRRLSTLLDHDAPGRLPVAAIPQVLPAAIYARHLSGMLDVREQTGRLFASLCLARRYALAKTWSEAATRLHLPAETGNKSARACSGDVLVRPDAFVNAIDDVAAHLDADIDHRLRESAVRHLAATSAWYRHWARRHHRGSHVTSRSYAITWLWTEHAHGHVDFSPGWQHPPDHHDRARCRAYSARLSPAARQALTALASTTPITTTTRTTS